MKYESSSTLSLSRVLGKLGIKSLALYYYVANDYDNLIFRKVVTTYGFKHEQVNQFLHRMKYEKQKEIYKKIKKSCN